MQVYKFLDRASLQVYKFLDIASLQVCNFLVLKSCWGQVFDFKLANLLRKFAPLSMFVRVQVFLQEQVCKFASFQVLGGGYIITKI